MIISNKRIKVHCKAMMSVLLVQSVQREKTGK